MTAPKQKPTTSAADLTTRQQAGAAELAAAEGVARDLEAALGVAMVADDGRAEQVQAELAAALAKVEQLRIAGDAFTAAAREHEQDEARRLRREQTREYNSELEAAKVDINLFVDAVEKLGPLADSARGHLREAEQLRRKLGGSALGRAVTAIWPYGHVLALVNGVAGTAFAGAGSRAAGEQAAAKLRGYAASLKMPEPD